MIINRVSDSLIEKINWKTMKNTYKMMLVAAMAIAGGVTAYHG